ncbi:hypothetical protein FNU76_09120 [Chitinimonas arctica]|uniref:Uncharacterized protein n=1 Tax=Chitinimonas arctica TaxID=2594795 RepID=A0A516SED3_9NEIS|nr:hypothetical protein [Chitinimonas arctica]QDQ26516.1 hypothetical protein FNU76_09120 [Chitinimonas arctica]
MGISAFHTATPNCRSSEPRPTGGRPSGKSCFKSYPSEIADIIASMFTPPTMPNIMNFGKPSRIYTVYKYLPITIGLTPIGVGLVGVVQFFSIMREIVASNKKYDTGEKIFMQQDESRHSPITAATGRSTQLANKQPLSVSTPPEAPAPRHLDHFAPIILTPLDLRNALKARNTLLGMKAPLLKVDACPIRLQENRPAPQPGGSYENLYKLMKGDSTSAGRSRQPASVVQRAAGVAREVGEIRSQPVSGERIAALKYGAAQACKRIYHLYDYTLKHLQDKHDNALITQRELDIWAKIRLAVAAIGIAAPAVCLGLTVSGAGAAVGAPILVGIGAAVAGWLGYNAIKGIQI